MVLTPPPPRAFKTLLPLISGGFHASFPSGSQGAQALPPIWVLAQGPEQAKGQVRTPHYLPGVLSISACQQAGPTAPSWAHSLPVLLSGSPRLSDSTPPFGLGQLSSKAPVSPLSTSMGHPPHHADPWKCEI